MSDSNAGPGRPTLRQWIAAIAIASAAGWVGVGEGAYCSLTISCLWYVPVVGGLLFAPIAVQAAVVAVAVMYLVLGVRPSAVAFLALACVMAALGFGFGTLPEVHGHGP